MAACASAGAVATVVIAAPRPAIASAARVVRTGMRMRNSCGTSGSDDRQRSIAYVVGNEPCLNLVCGPDHTVVLHAPSTDERTETNDNAALRFQRGVVVLGCEEGMSFAGLAATYSPRA
ncbi:predicted protein [Bradyrhizobium oligotrophicum S58]|uniref:Uncharacterized protein n=1 Tax=Bradyrhizobium oligotrophicum S58 TaxID=1245469 RepID=M4ZG82_9BRAD|nr:predicted protein [Bradyrhizobium oligotrophicum S58]